MSRFHQFICYFSILLLTACGSSGAARGPGRQSLDDVDGNVEQPVASVTLRADVERLTRAEDALPGVFVPPFVQCRTPMPGEPEGAGQAGKVCTPVSIAGCTEEGRYYPDYGDCQVVLTQRPFWTAPPASVPRDDDPRLGDPAFMGELDWVTRQLEASACTCCHDSRQNEGQAAQWDIQIGPIWTDTISDDGVALFTGLADSRALGAYAPEDNNGFDRTFTGVPTTDSERMQRFFKAELARRGRTEAEARDVTPFGGPVYRSLTSTPVPCADGQGVGPDGRVRWNPQAPIRYLYVLQAGSDNPGVPPNLDLPEGTVWRLDVLANQPALTSGIPYGQTPPGTFQAFPELEAAPALKVGESYRLYVLYDMGIEVTHCTFTYRT